ncbi:uncharacterized protein LOC121533572 isoform X2 [Coregonus clupeaformis]|nr:uncharacterized protein LOC121533572 isoform X2 [Coregonus clupeaformis]
MYVLANESSVALYRLQEHVRESLPELVLQKTDMQLWEEQSQGAIYTVEYACRCPSLRGIGKTSLVLARLRDLTLQCSEKHDKQQPALQKHRWAPPSSHQHEGTDQHLPEAQREKNNRSRSAKGGRREAHLWDMMIMTLWHCSEAQFPLKGSCGVRGSSTVHYNVALPLTSTRHSPEWKANGFDLPGPALRHVSNALLSKTPLLWPLCINQLKGL